MHAVHTFRLVSLRQMLELRFHFRERVGIEQLAQFRLAEQLLQLRLIDRKRLRAPLRQRRIAVVDVICDVPKEQRRREGGRDR